MAKLYFYYSAMNAGKSTVLLQSSHNYRERGMRTLLFAPSVDYRAGVGRIESRIGLSSDATALTRADDLRNRVRTEHATSPLACVLIDEAQFLTPDQVWQAADVADTLNIPVLCYGLRTDFQGNNRQDFAEEAFEIKLRNRKAEPVTVRVVEHLYRWTNWTVLTKSDELAKKDAQTIEFSVLLQPDQERSITYRVRYDWR